MYKLISGTSSLVRWTHMHILTQTVLNAYMVGWCVQPEMNLPAVYGMVGSFLPKIPHVVTGDLFGQPGYKTRSCQQDKLAAIREVWDKWVEHLPLVFNASLNVTVMLAYDQYMLSKSSKYGTKKWATCDSRTSCA